MQDDGDVEGQGWRPLAGHRPAASALHLDAVAGSDEAGDGSAERPWRSLARGLAALLPGDVLRLKAGSVFREDLVIRTPGVTVEPYGIGAAPRISGGVLLGPKAPWARLARSPAGRILEDFEGDHLAPAWTRRGGVRDRRQARRGRWSWRCAPAAGEEAWTARPMGGDRAGIAGWLRIAAAGPGAGAARAPVAGFESGTGAAFLWLERRGDGGYRLGPGGRDGPAAGALVPAGTWLEFRFAVEALGQPDRAAATLRLGGIKAVQRLERPPLTPEAYEAGFGLRGPEAAAFALWFDDLASGSADSVGEPAETWFVEGIEAEPLVVTLDGQPGRRRPARALLAAAGDHWWDARSRRLYLCRAGLPAAQRAAIEYAARYDPVRIEAPFVTLRGLQVSHHNLDDRGGGIAAGRHWPTVALPGMVLRHSGRDVADHAARPGRADSPWNRRLDDSAHYAAPPPGFGTLNVVLGGWLSPAIATAIHQARTGDPMVEVLYNPEVWTRVASGTWARAGNAASVEAAILAGARPDFSAAPFGARSRYVYQTAAEGHWSLPDSPPFHPAPPPQRGMALRVRCPRGVVPPPDTDGYLAVFQPDGRVFEAYCPVILGDGRIVCFSWGITDAGGALAGEEGGVCASLIPAYAGAIRDGEITAGAIPHAIALYAPEAHLAPAARWPALTWDRTNAYRGTLPMGTRLAIPPGVELAGLKLDTVAGRAIARAAQDYGMIIVDRNGGDGLVLKVQYNAPRDAPVTRRYDAAVWRDLRGIVERLQVVS